ncbi:DNA-binding response OmpR family regulator [Aurantimicrobium minutum]|uniref:response regulator transcription factor n=1 Tax=Aurantimicrobium minutum TaxID=708131 RepID=UPI0024758027|nr:response regulator transcription factor [Aurantimicrobium minutum]MDH6531978.1 DNA-binding response OmpR family regulator [Aurantimicrobium minutum]
MSAHRVLVVDDDADIRDLVALKLQASGLDVDTAADGITGLEKATQLGFDAIVLDVMMPGMSGIDVLQALRSAGNQTPVILLTAKTQEHDVEAGFNAGANDYVSKPFSPRELLARVTSVLSRT